MDWSYIAGFFDGEGCVGVYGRGHQITISQKDKSVLVAIQTFTDSEGIRSHLRGYPSRTSGKMHCIVITAKPDLEKFISKVLSYSIVKRDALMSMSEALKNVHSFWWNNPEVIKRIVELRVKHYSFREITELIGCSYGTVHRILDSEGFSHKRYRGLREINIK